MVVGSSSHGEPHQFFQGKQVLLRIPENKHGLDTYCVQLPRSIPPFYRGRNKVQRPVQGLVWGQRLCRSQSPGGISRRHELGAAWFKYCDGTQQG